MAAVSEAPVRLSPFDVARQLLAVAPDLLADFRSLDLRGQIAVTLLVPPALVTLVALRWILAVAAWARRSPEAR
jgi:hypothetical protein